MRLRRTDSAAPSVGSERSDENGTFGLSTLTAVKAVLENTPAIARSRYVDPRVFDRSAHGEAVDSSRPTSVESQLRAMLFS